MGYGKIKRKHKRGRGRRRRNSSSIIIIVLAVLLVIAVIALIFILLKNPFSGSDDKETTTSGIIIETTTVPEETSTTEAESVTTEAETSNTIVYSSDAILAQAQKMAAMYDYDNAINLLQSVADYESNQEYKDAVEEFTATKKTMVKWQDNTQITHIFFHTLVADNALSFDGDYKTDDYNTVMTTISEFNKMMELMYEKGYVLVKIHDIARMETQEDGTQVMKAQPIYLPAGKKPFVLSQDDVSYYAYMDGDGYATRLIVTDDGKVTNEMKLADGSTVTGSFDMVPLLEDFIEKHPDFSYRGARGIIALTGYEGVLGYRTSDYHYGPNCANNDAKYPDPNPNIEADKQTAKKVAEAMKDLGWEFATHGWGHIAMGANRGYDGFVWDLDMWLAEVAPIIGDTDIVIYPKGDDVGSFRAYTDTEKQTELAVSKYNYMKEKGFDYFCNVDGSTPYWVQITSNYMRMGRINADGQAFYEAVVDYRNKLKHILSNDEIRDIFDPDRPTPVPGVPVN